MRNGVCLRKHGYIISRKDSSADSRKTGLCTKSDEQQWSINKWEVRPESNGNGMWYLESIILEKKWVAKVVNLGRRRWMGLIDQNSTQSKVSKWVTLLLLKIGNQKNSMHISITGEYFLST